MQTQFNGAAAKVKFKTSDPVKDLELLSHIMINLRHHTQKWKRYYGGKYRTNMKAWEDKADQWLKDHSDPDDLKPFIQEDEE